MSTESVREYRASQSGGVNQAMLQFVNNVRENVRESIGQFKLPPPPLQASKWVANRREAAVRFVSAVRSPVPPSCL